MLSLTTDMGIERYLANLSDIVPDMLASLGCPARFIPPRGRRLFQRALHIRGWRHFVDLLLESGLCLCAFFPRWLSDFKAAVYLLRNASTREFLCVHLTAAGFHAISEMVSKVGLKNFADWRWCTLEDCIECLKGVLEPLSGVINWQWFISWHDHSRLDCFRRLLTSPIFFAEVDFVHWYSRWLGNLMRWVGTCRCECATGAACFWRGRLLRDAFTTAQNYLQEGLDAANNWEMAHWRGHVHLWQQSTAAVRFAYARGCESIAYLDKLPWILARLDIPGMAGRIIGMFDAMPMHAHHPLSVEFLSPHHPSGLRMFVDAIDEHGGNLHPRLREALQGLQDIPLDDVTAEGPHAKAKRIIERASHGSFSWTASSCRLDQNLETFQETCVASGRDPQTEWDRWSSVIKMRRTYCRSNRPQHQVAAVTYDACS